MLFEKYSVFVFFITFVFSYAVFYIQQRRKVYRKYPPGPVGFPILGHLPFLGWRPWEAFEKWKKQYGPIFSIKMGSYRTIILSDPKVIRDALNLPEFSGRPKLHAYKLAGDNAFIAGDGQYFREQRNFSMRCLKNFQITKLLEEKTLQEMDDIFKTFQKTSKNWKIPIEMDAQFNVPTMNALWSLFMGERFEHDDPKLLEIVHLMHEVNTVDGILKPLFYFVSFLPKLFPRARCMEQTVEVINMARNFVDQEFQKNKLLERSETPANFMEAFRQEMQLHQNDPESSFYEPHGLFPLTTSDIFLAAMETTSTAITWFILLMTLHPEVQDRLHEEILHFIGASRPPSLNDRHHCHFAEAVVNEVLRFSCLVPMAVFHRTVEDIPDFHGFRIPANTLIIPDIAGIHMDPELWKHPEQFDPSRFIGVDGKFQKSDNLLPFSIGKRNCIVETIARKQLFLYVAGISQRFKLSYPAGKKPLTDRIVGIVIRPPNFEVLFKERY